MPNAVAIRSQYGDFYGSGQLPVLEEIFRMEIAQHPMRRPELFKVVPHDRDIYQSSEIHDVDLFQAVSENSEYSFKRSKQGANKTLTVVKYGLGVSISEEAVDDGKFDLLAEMVRKLGRSAIESQEISGMNVFNNGFGSETTSDGVAIFSASHTLPSGGTLRNVLSTVADLSVTSLDQALQDFETQFVGDTGIIYNMRAKWLLCHPSNKRYAKELVGSMNKPDTADNNLNSFKDDGLMVMSSPHLTDSDAWFLVASPGDQGLRVIQRTGIETKASDPAVGFTTDSLFYKSRYREVLGCLHPFGLFGTAGA